MLEEDITPPGLGQGQSNLSLEAQALDVACRCIRVAHTDNEVFKVVNTLAVALGARRTEIGTIKALHAVLLQLVWPDMSNAEARSLTGASMSNCTKWRSRVLKVKSEHLTHSTRLPPESSSPSLAQDRLVAGPAPGT